MTVMPEKFKAKIGVNPATSFSRKSTSKTVPSEPTPRDKEISSALADYNEKKRSSSLADLHTSKIEKKKRKDDKPTKRQPLEFDPETALGERVMDKTQRKSVMDKAKLLNTRFSGGSSKFL